MERGDKSNLSTFNKLRDNGKVWLKVNEEIVYKMVMTAGLDQII